MQETTTIYDAEDATEEVITLATSIADGWYPEGPIDWEDVWDRLDGASLDDGTRLDLGENLLSPALKKIKREILKARKDG